MPCSTRLVLQHNAFPSTLGRLMIGTSLYEKKRHGGSEHDFFHFIHARFAKPIIPCTIQTSSSLVPWLLYASVCDFNVRTEYSRRVQLLRCSTHQGLATTVLIAFNDVEVFNIDVVAVSFGVLCIQDKMNRSRAWPP